MTDEIELMTTRHIELVGLQIAGGKLTQRSLFVGEHRDSQRVGHCSRKLGLHAEQVRGIGATFVILVPDQPAFIQIFQLCGDAQCIAARDADDSIEHVTHVRQLVADMFARLVVFEREGGGGRYDPQARDLAQVTDHLARHLICEGAPRVRRIARNIEGHDQDVGKFGAGRRGLRLEIGSAEYCGRAHDQDRDCERDLPSGPGSRSVRFGFG